METLVCKESRLTQALIEFHNTNPVATKDNKGAWGNYATLEQVIATCRLATKHGLTFTQEPDFSLTNDKPVEFVRTVIMHVDGGKRESRTLVHVPAKFTGDPQAHGKGITYAKRYGLCAAFGLPTEDDDADSISKNAQTKLGNTTEGDAW